MTTFMAWQTDNGIDDPTSVQEAITYYTRKYGVAPTHIGCSAKSDLAALQATFPTMVVAVDACIPYKNIFFLRTDNGNEPVTLKRTVQPDLRTDA